jgi:uncharacterized membrane protein YfcA
MKKNLNLFTTLVLMTGLMAPSATFALGRYADTAATTASASAGWSFGGSIGQRLGDYVANLIRGHEGKILIGGIVAVAVYYVYTNSREESTHHRTKKHPRARSCSNKGCSHKKCK